MLLRSPAPRLFPHSPAAGCAVSPDSRDRSSHSDRTFVALSASGFTVAAKKIVSRVSGATTACGLTPGGCVPSAPIFESALGMGYYAFSPFFNLSSSSYPASLCILPRPRLRSQAHPLPHPCSTLSRRIQNACAVPLRTNASDALTRLRDGRDLQRNAVR